MSIYSKNILSVSLSVRLQKHECKNIETSISWLLFKIADIFFYFMIPVINEHRFNEYFVFTCFSYNFKELRYLWILSSLLCKKIFVENCGQSKFVQPN